MSKKALGVYIDLDSLLDTRLGTIAKYDKDIAISNLDNNDYYTRTTEDFIGIDKSIFDELYKNRDIDTLKESTITNIVFIIREFTLGLIKLVADHPIYDRIKVYVNTYPYILNNDENNDLIEIIRGYTFDTCDVSVIHKSFKELDCMWVYLNVQHMFIYHYNDWLNERGKELSHRGLPELSVYCPKIYFSHTPTNEEKEELDKLNDGNSIDYFSVFSDLYSCMLQLNFMPIDHFSVVNTYQEEYESYISTLNGSESV